jgi:hypothetical protein
LHEHGGDALVVGAKVVAPVRDAVSFVDDDESDGRTEVGESRGERR